MSRPASPTGPKRENRNGIPGFPEEGEALDRSVLGEMAPRHPVLPPTLVLVITLSGLPTRSTGIIYSGGVSP